MNKDLLNQIPADEQPVASKINSLIEDMQPSYAFQWDLENQLMDKATTQPAQSWFTKVVISLGWVIAVIGGVLLLNWTIHSLIPPPAPAAGPTATREVSFEENIRQGNSCPAPLTIAHNFAVFLTSQDKTQFAVVDAGNSIGETRSFTWSADGKELFLLGNTTGSGNIYHADPFRGEVRPVLAEGKLGYMMDAAWSRDGKKVALWSAQNNKVLYVMNADGTGLVEKNLGNTQILGAPQFWPDGSSVVFYGATPTTIGLFEWILNDTNVAQINSYVKSASSYAFSPDGSKLAYMSYDKQLTGQAELWTEDLSTHATDLLGTFSIPKGSGSSVPQTANMTWSPDGKLIVFDVGRGANDRIIYLARTGESELLKVVDDGYAPAISNDGQCLAYISNKKLYLLDLNGLLKNPAASASWLIGDLPAGAGVSNYQLDKLQWRPE